MFFRNYLSNYIMSNEYSCEGGCFAIIGFLRLKLCVETKYMTSKAIDYAGMRIASVQNDIAVVEKPGRLRNSKAFDTGCKGS